jgi:3-hydroxyisobutyrate dehydrogenase
MGNAIFLGGTGLVADIMTIGAGGGLTPDDAVKLFTIVDPAAFFKAKVPKMASGVFDNPTFELIMARKDIRLMIETAGENPLSVLPGVAARMDHYIERGFGAKDTNIIVSHVFGKQ